MNRPHTIQIRVTEKQKQALEKRAAQLTKNLGDTVTVSSLIRNLINKHVAGALVLLVLLSACSSDAGRPFLIGGVWTSDLSLSEVRQYSFEDSGRAIRTVKLDGVETERQELRFQVDGGTLYFRTTEGQELGMSFVPGSTDLRLSGDINEDLCRIQSNGKCFVKLAPLN